MFRSDAEYPIDAFGKLTFQLIRRIEMLFIQAGLMQTRCIRELQNFKPKWLALILQLPLSAQVLSGLRETGLKLF